MVSKELAKLEKIEKKLDELEERLIEFEAFDHTMETIIENKVFELRGMLWIVLIGVLALLAITIGAILRSVL